MKRQFLPDGMLWEVDLSYHIGTVANFYDVVVLVQANHCEDILPALYLESMRKSTSLLMNLMYPDYTLEAFNDTRRTWTKSTIVKNLNKYVRMFPDNKEMQWVATSGKSGVKPTHLTQAFTSSGYYVLRDGWDKSSTMLIHTNNPTAAWHNQGTTGLSLFTGTAVSSSPIQDVIPTIMGLPVSGTGVPSNIIPLLWMINRSRMPTAMEPS